MVDFETFIFAYVFSGCLLHHAGGLIFPVGVLVVSFLGLGWVGSRPCGVKTGGTSGACKRQCCSKPLRCRMLTLNSGTILFRGELLVFRGNDEKWGKKEVNKS